MSNLQLAIERLEGVPATTGLKWNDTVDGSEIRRSPVDMVNIKYSSPIIYRPLSYIPSGCLGFLPSTVSPNFTFWKGFLEWITCEVVKKLQELLHDLFFVIVFFLPYRFTGDCDYSNKYNIIDLVLQTIFCMTSLPNSITSNIISRGRRQQSRRRQRCSSRRQRQRQLRGSEVPRAGLGEEDFFC